MALDSATYQEAVDERLQLLEDLVEMALARGFDRDELTALADDAEKIAHERTDAAPLPGLQNARMFRHRAKLLRAAAALAGGSRP